MIYDTSDTVWRWSLDIVRHWSSDTVQRWSSDAVRRWSSAVTILFGYNPMLELGYIPMLELGSGPALVLGCKRYLECSPALELGCKRTPPHGKHFKPEAWHKYNKALIKAEDLKGSSDTRRVNSSDSPRRSSRSMMRRFVEPVFKTDGRR